MKLPDTTAEPLRGVGDIRWAEHRYRCQHLRQIEQQDLDQRCTRIPAVGHPVATRCQVA